MMAATDAADHQMQQGLTDVAPALTSLASGESANGSIAGAEQLQAALIRMEANMSQLTQTVANQQAQLAAATQQQPPMMPYCALAMQRQPFQPMQFNGQQNGHSNNRNNTNRNNNNNNNNSRAGANAKHPIKRFENQNYCHTCGFYVESAHTSQTCPWPKILCTVSLTAQNRIRWAILDSGVSSHFLLSAAPVHDKKVATNPLHIKLLDGTTIESSHTANIALPQLPPMARVAHIVPSLASHSLVSVVKLCNAGCKVVMDDISCEVHYRGKPVIQCSKCMQTGLWMIPLVPEKEQGPNKPSAPQDGVSHQAHHVHQSSTKPEAAQFYHQSLFSPPVVTLLKAVNNEIT